MPGIHEGDYTDQEDFLIDARRVMEQMHSILKTKGSSHGLGCWQSLGLRGLFVEINQKFHRIKTEVWDDEPCLMDEETLVDAYMDMANYCIMSVARIYNGGKKYGSDETNAVR